MVNKNHPARELMWGSPGTLLAALFMYQRTGEPKWADLFRDTAAVLWSQLEWSDEESCHYWTQDLYGHRSTYVDAVHGFVATASPLIQGRHLLKAADWEGWRECIATTVRRTAQWEGELASWRPQLSSPRGDLKLMQWLRLPQALPPHGRRPMAGPRKSVRHAGNRADRCCP